MRIRIFGAAAGVMAALWASGALAQPVAMIGAGNTDILSTQGGGHVDDWSVNGAVATPVGASRWKVQGDAAYNSLSGNGADVRITNLAATLFREGEHGRLGVTAGHNAFTNGLSSYTNYGAFGEYWAGERTTLAVKAGTIQGGGDHGSYYGAQIVAYPRSSLALSASYEHLEQGGADISVSTAQAETSLSEHSPLSLRAGYAYVDLNGIHANAWTAGFTWRFGARGSLVQRHRSGPDTWGVGATTLKF